MKLKIKFLPYENLKKMPIKDIIRDLKKNMIILIDAKLKANEEAELIEETMKKISRRFTGIELSSLELDADTENKKTFRKIKDRLIESIIGKKRGMTIIGPAKIIKKIEKNPEDLLFYV